MKFLFNIPYFLHCRSKLQNQFGAPLVVESSYDTKKCGKGHYGLKYLNMPIKTNKQPSFIDNVVSINVHSFANY